jgi:MoxR-like ATPase
VLDAESLAVLQATTPEIYVDPGLANYAVAIVAATRQPELVGQADLKRYIGFGASPRGSINLVHAARALALLRGRRYVIPADIYELAPDVLRHRIVPSFTALAEEITPDAILARILPAVPAPRLITEERSA